MINAFIAGVVIAWIAEWLFFLIFIKKKKTNATSQPNDTSNNFTSELESSLKELESEKDELSNRITELEEQALLHKKDQATSLSKLKKSEEQVKELTNKLQEKTANGENIADEVEAASTNSDSELSASDEEEEVKNDLSVINGIGPKLHEALNNLGIYSFNHLIAADINELMETLKENGVRFNKNNANTWAQQATLAAQGDWSGLDALKEELKG